MSLPEDMIPIELCVIKPMLCGKSLSPSAFLCQWLEINEPMAWRLRQAHALSQGDHITGFLIARKMLSN